MRRLFTRSSLGAVGRSAGAPLLGMLATRLALVAVLTLPARAVELAQRTLLLDAVSVGQAVVAVGERGTILHSTDHAVTWTALPARTTATLTGVAFGDAQHGWAVGHDATILVTGDGGMSWARQWQGENLTDSFLDVLALDPTHVIAVGAYGLYVESTDGGRTWNRQHILTDDYHLNRISRGPTGTLYLAGEHGTLLRSNNQGAAWTAIPAPYDGSFYGILPLGAHSLLAYGLRGRVFRSDDDGANWTAVATNETVLLATAAQLPSGTVVLAGQARALLLGDGKAAFVRRAVNVLTGIAELLPLTDGALLAVGEAGATRIPSAQLAPSVPVAAPAKP